MQTLSLTVTREQAEIIDHPATMKVVTCGRRWGKTFAAPSYLVKIALKNPLRESSYVGKTYKLAYKMFRRISTQRQLQQFVRNSKQQPSPHIEWKNGHTTWFFSGDRPDNLRGDGMVVCIVDESAHVPERLINEILQPVMLDQGGTLVLMSTFRGRNFHYDWHIKGNDYPNDEDVKSWLYPTSTAIWAQTDAGKLRLKRMKARLPDMVWRQECECIVDANQAAVFNPSKIAACTHGELRGPRTGYGYIIGYDSGKAEDPPAIVVLECEPSGEKCAVVLAENMSLGTPYPAQVDRVSELAKLYNAYVFVDSTGAGTKDAIVDFLRQKDQSIAVHGVQLRGNIPENLVKLGAWHFENGHISVPPQCVELLNQIRQLEFERTQRDHYRYRAPIGDHDDLCWALLMALHGKKRGMYQVAKESAPRPPEGSQGRALWNRRHPQPEMPRL